MEAAPPQTPQAGPDGWWLFGFCATRIGFGLIFTAYPAALALLRVEWGMSAGEAGSIQSAWHVGYLVSLFTVGFLADRFGAKRVFLWGSVAAAATALAFAFGAHGYASALVLYGLTGLCSGASYTPALAVIAQRYPAQGRGRAMGFYLAAASLGYAISLALSSVIIPLAGWRGSFIVTGSGPLLGMLLGFWVLRATPNVIPPPAPERARGGSIVAVLRNRPAMLIMTAYMFHSWELLGVWAWLPAFLGAAAAHGGGTAAKAASLGAVMTALTHLIAVGGSIAGGSLSDRFGRTAVILWMSIASMVCTFATGWMLGLPLWVLLGMAVIVQFAGIGDSSVFSTGITELVPPRYIGAAYSLRSVMGFGVGAIAPWVFGLALDWGRAGPQASEWLAWGLAWSTLGLGGLFGPLATLRLRARPEARAMAGGLR